MNCLVFRTNISSAWTKAFILLCIVIFLCLTFIIYWGSEVISLVGLLFFVSYIPIMYIILSKVYVVTSDALIIKSKLSRDIVLPWGEIKKIATVKGEAGRTGGIRIDYTRENGVKGFYVIRNIKNLSSMLSAIEQRWLYHGAS
ncbi:MAG: hypothetical protein RSH25_03525 [Bacteroides sp.]|uniref:hypothetical protein n=2 Tax=Bacteroides sp. TaxID=29523 RepID=UPI002FC7C010